MAVRRVNWKQNYWNDRSSRECPKNYEALSFKTAPLVFRALQRTTQRNEIHGRFARRQHSGGKLALPFDSHVQRAVRL